MGLFDIFKKEDKKEEFVPIRESRRRERPRRSKDRRGLPRLPETSSRSSRRPSRFLEPEMPTPNMPLPGQGSERRGSERSMEPSSRDTTERRMRTILSELDFIKSELREIRIKLDRLSGKREERRSYGERKSKRY